MSHEELEPYLTELRRLSGEIQQQLSGADPIIRAINDQLLALAARRPQWEITIVADVVMHHHDESADSHRRLLSAGVRIPHGVAVCIWQHADTHESQDEAGLELTGMRPKFLPYTDAPPLLRRLLLPLIGYALESFCQQLRP